MRDTKLRKRKTLQVQSKRGLKVRQSISDMKREKVWSFLCNYVDESMPLLLEQIEANCAGGEFKNKRERRQYAEALRELFGLPYYEDDEW